jgi:hypothetical protein
VICIPIGIIMGVGALLYKYWVGKKRF